MKKSLIFISILFLFVIPLISAVEFDMKSKFSQGETLMARVSGNFLEPILKENIFFYRGHVRIPMEYDVSEINNEFYIYALLSDKEPKNYSLIIKDTRYMKGSQISEEEIVKNFLITENMSDFSINPGFIITKDAFFIEVQNLQDYEITIQIKTKNETSEESEDKGILGSLFGGKEDDSEGESITLMSGEIKKINFELEEVEQPTLKLIELSTENLTYEVPLYVFTEEESENKERGFNLEPSNLNISISTNSNTTRIIHLYNTGQEKLRNILLSVSDSLKPYIELSIEEIEELDENSSIKIEFYIFSEDEANIEGNIKAKTEDETLLTYSAISLNFLEGYIPSEDDEEIIVTKTCLELDGTICDGGEECDEPPINAKDAVCCLGNCKKVEKSQVGKIIGWGMIIIIAGFLIWFFMKKYKKTKKPVDLLKIARGKKNPVFSKFPEANKEIKRRVPERVADKRALIVPSYTGSSKTKTYHKTSCKFSKLIEDKYKVSKDNFEYFNKEGYKPCKKCMK